jgi:hypothetical protein
VHPVVFPVAQVVDEIGRAGDRAVGAEGRDRLEPPPRIAELGREHEAREDEQILQPLPGPQCHDRRSSGRAPLWELENLGRGDHRAGF